MESDLIILRSPFNGETITVTPDSCSPAMLAAMERAGFINLKPKNKPKQKEVNHG